MHGHGLASLADWNDQGFSSIIELALMLSDGIITSAVTCPPAKLDAFVARESCNSFIDA
jgi:hypothetical protein